MAHGPDLWSLYESMKRSRLFEESVAQLWHEGAISGEMHLGTGEEAIVAGVVSQLADGDAMALDHRGTAPMLMRGVDPIALVREFVGRPDGLCGGQGGHMHLFSKEHLASSSGIVGASGPAGAGFGLAADHLRPGSVSVAFFGEGAMNQGMLMESINLAGCWSLPVVFVCKDDGWAITTRPEPCTSGQMADRVAGLGVEYEHVDGLDVEAVWHAAHRAIERARAGRGPGFLHADCVHLEGHFMGLALLRMQREPLRELPPVALDMTRSFIRRGGAPLPERFEGLGDVISALARTARDPRRRPANDPLNRTRQLLDADTARLDELDARLEREIAQVFQEALGRRSS